MNQAQYVQPEIEVLLATFNGARFLRSQIESILGQSWQALRILARDDGSTDETGNLLAEYAERFPKRFRVLATDEPTGSAKLNFKKLLGHSTARWVAFADQDDVWRPEKLQLCAAAMERLEHKYGMDKPLLIFSDLEIVSETLETIHHSFWAHEGFVPATAHRLERLLLQNVVTGCTMLINRPLVEMAEHMPPEALMHDQWIALLACLFGKADSLPQPLVRYRQHADNVVGASRRMTLRRIMRGLSNKGRDTQWKLSERQAVALQQSSAQGRTLPSLTAAHSKTICAFVRSGGSPHRLTRILTAIRYGIVYSSLRRTLTWIWYLWNKEARSS